MNISLLFDNLTIEEFKQLLHLVLVPKLAIPLKNKKSKYFKKDIPVLSLSREAIEEVYINHVYKKDKDMTLALHLTNQVVDLINQDDLSDQYALLLRKKHNKEIDNEFIELLTNLETRKVHISINVFFKLLGEEEVDLSILLEDFNHVDSDVLTDIEDIFYIEDEEDEDEEEEVFHFSEDLGTTIELEDDSIPEEEVTAGQVTIHSSSQQEISLLDKGEDLFSTMDFIDETIKNFRKEINEISQITNKKISEEEEDVNLEEYQKLKREKNFLSMELNKKRIKILTLESQLDQAIYSMKAYAKKVEEIVDDLVGRQEMSKNNLIEAMTIIQQYQTKYQISGKVSIDDLWIELSRVEEELLNRLMKEKKDSSKENYQKLNQQLQETIRVKEAIQLLLSTNDFA